MASNFWFVTQDEIQYIPFDVGGPFTSYVSPWVVHRCGQVRVSKLTD